MSVLLQHFWGAAAPPPLCSCAYGCKLQQPTQ